MISAQVDQRVQDHLIESYMMLPNQVWDDIIGQASKVTSLLQLLIYVFLKSSIFINFPIKFWTLFRMLKSLLITL
jgi:hypothetical protein